MTERLVTQTVHKVFANAARKQDGVDSRIGELLPGDGLWIWRRSFSPMRMVPPKFVMRRARIWARMLALDIPPDIIATSAGSGISNDTSLR